MYEFFKIADGEAWFAINRDTLIHNWVPYWVKSDVGRIRLTAGESLPFRFTWLSPPKPGSVDLKYRKTQVNMDEISLWSEVGDGIDYYFVYGPDADRVISGYRILTGKAPMMPEWSLGFWQCRERYKTADEILDVLQTFRQHHIPIDNIILDWQYWKLSQWGSHEFDKSRFPDPEGMIKEIHDSYHAHFMISVWPKFYAGTANFDSLNRHGFLYPENIKEGTKDWMGYNYSFYDAFNPGARKMFWKMMSEKLFSLGVDAWWMDATEPEMVADVNPGENAKRMNPTWLGSGARYLNAYSLMNSKAVYEGQRSTAPGQRVFILTRSAFAGQQRYASATWSGDIASRWSAFKRQIPAGLNFSISGIPYWTTDIGGFTNDWDQADPEWHELQVRWFEYGAFCPVFRVHGQSPYREMWEFGGFDSPAFKAQLKYDKMRYRLMPYIYSLAGRVTRDDYTIMRPLVMDFPSDPKVTGIDDQFMFGPSLLVNPVTEYGMRSRDIYLPAGGWYDIHNGKYHEGGRMEHVEAPLDEIPVFAREGSIIPLGPRIEYTGQDQQGPITVFIYGGKDAAFELYEDDGITFDYEKGLFSSIGFSWNESGQELTIGSRRGHFPGMVHKRIFRIVLVKRNKALPLDAATQADKTMEYDGNELNVRF